MEGTEAYFDIRDKKSSSFVVDIAKAKARNDKLRQVVMDCFTVLHAAAASWLLLPYSSCF